MNVSHLVEITVGKIDANGKTSGVDTLIAYRNGIMAIATLSEGVDAVANYVEYRKQCIAHVLKKMTVVLPVVRSMADAIADYINDGSLTDKELRFKLRTLNLGIGVNLTMGLLPDLHDLFPSQDMAAMVAYRREIETNLNAATSIWEIPVIRKLFVRECSECEGVTRDFAKELISHTILRLIPKWVETSQFAPGITAEQFGAIEKVYAKHRNNPVAAEGANKETAVALVKEVTPVEFHQYLPVLLTIAHVCECVAGHIDVANTPALIAARISEWEEACK